jgi:Pyruvate/2-oxoglutarate dehydrogenase complex, dehydrogenase (E1) component, eukaryotic type, alpha subunit
MTNPVRLQRRLELASPESRLDRMIEIRVVEEAIQELFNAGHVRGSTHLCNGQEAVSVGVAASIQPTDTVTCTYRGHGHALALGLTPLDVIGEICGRTVGCAGGIGGSMHLFGADVGLLPTFAIVGAGLPIATGAALAAQVRGADSLAVALFGDGSTNIGAFHESLNLASVRRLPVIFVCENNLYGEYTRITLSTPIDDLALRAESYGMPGIVVDGQDLDAVMAAMGDAVDRARRGDGPTLLEMKTYRYSGHSRSDPATYRPDGELEHWQARDPIDLYASKLRVDPAVLNDGARRTIAAAVDAVLAAPHPAITAITAHVISGGEQG